jgi:hypothetical protein
VGTRRKREEPMQSLYSSKNMQLMGRTSETLPLRPRKWMGTSTRFMSPSLPCDSLTLSCVHFHAAMIDIVWQASDRGCLPFTAVSLLKDPPHSPRFGLTDHRCGPRCSNWQRVRTTHSSMKPVLCPKPHHQNFPMVGGELCLPCTVNRFGVLGSTDTVAAATILREVNTMLLPELCRELRGTGSIVVKSFTRNVAKCWDYGDLQISTGASNVRVSRVARWGC